MLGSTVCVRDPIDTLDQRPRKRARFSIEGEILSPSHESPSPNRKVDKDLASKLHRPHPLLIRPSGNALFDPRKARLARTHGLGSFDVLSDELIIELLAALDPRALLRLQILSRAFFAFTRHQALWKVLYIERSGGRLDRWEGDWRRTYWAQFMADRDTIQRLRAVEDDEAEERDLVMPADSIKTPSVYSDALYQPHLCSLPISRHFASPNALDNLRTQSATALSPDVFGALYAATSTPVVVSSLVSHWPCLRPDSSHSWRLASLVQRFGSTPFRAEAATVPMHVYARYCASVERAEGCVDESPLYLFDSEFVRRTGGEMGHEYEVPPIFGEDLFRVMGQERPDYRWLIVGPSRAGSSWHKDPNSTSAWNAIITGAKGWILFPPDTVPPGVFVSEDESEVTAPLSIAEWFNSYYAVSVDQYGPHAKDPAARGKMVQGVCRAGEVMYIPAGWWHLVVNLTESVAVTQNFVSLNELPAVLHFLSHKADQISGFKLRGGSAGSAHEADEAQVNGRVHERFCAALERALPGVVERARAEGGLAASADAHAGKRDVETRKRGVWETVKGRKQAGEVEGGEQNAGFSFSFDVGGDAVDEEFIGW